MKEEVGEAGKLFPASDKKGGRQRGSPPWIRGSLFSSFRVTKSDNNKKRERRKLGPH